MTEGHLDDEPTGARLRAYEDVLRHLSAGKHEALISRCIADACQLLGLEFGMLGRVDGNTWRLVAHHGRLGNQLGRGALSATGTLPIKMLDSLSQLALPRIADPPALGKLRHPAHTATSIELGAYLGAPVYVRNDLFGELSFSSTSPRSRDFTNEELGTVELLSDVIGRFLEIAALEGERADSLRRMNQAETRTHMIVDAIADGVVTFGADGLIRSINPAIEAMFSQPGGGMLGCHVRRLFPAAAMWGLDPGAWIGRRETRGLRRDGTWMTLDIAISRATVDGEPFFTAILRDVSERRRIEGLKNEFVSVVSHELRTPLTAIRGSLGLLESGVLAPAGEQARELTRIALRNTDRLVRLIDDILDLDKLEAGGIQIEQRPLLMGEMIESTIESLKSVADLAEVRLLTELWSRPVVVLGDRDRLVQVLTNLISNATKFSSAGGYVKVTMAARGREIEVSVHDDGPGIAEADRERVFDKFEQLGGGQPRAEGGFGLGLPISKQIVELHNGRIGVASKLGQGSRFWFCLPLVDAGPT